MDKPHRDRRYDGAREVIGNYVTDFAREFADQAPLSSSITRAQNIYRASGLTLEAFVEHLYAARQITKARSGSIRGDASTRDRKPKKDQTIQAQQETIRWQEELIRELQRQERSVAVPPVTFRQWIDGTLIGRMLKARERRLAEPEGPSLAPAP